MVREMKRIDIARKKELNASRLSNEREEEDEIRFSFLFHPKARWVKHGREALFGAKRVAAPPRRARVSWVEFGYAAKKNASVGEGAPRCCPPAAPTQL